MINKKKDERLVNLQSKVKKNINKLCDFDKTINLVSVNTNSCFDFNKAVLPKSDNFIPSIDNSNEDIPKYKSLIVNMSVNNKQYEILNKWFDSYVDMYNETIHFFIKTYVYDDIRNLKIINDDTNLLYNDVMKIKNELASLLKQKKKLNTDYNKILKKKRKNKSFNTELMKNNKIKINELIKEITNLKSKIKGLNIILNTKTQEHKKSQSVQKKEYKKLMIKLSWKNVRTDHLKNIRDHIQAKSATNNNLRIRTHILDCAIKKACTSYKSCTTNYLNGNIKKFRIRYWRNNKKNKTLEIEKEFIKNEKLLPDVFGDFKFTYNDKEYKLTGNETITILHCSDTRKYYLLVAEKVKLKETKSQKYMTIDQGIKPFASCRTNDELINIGTNIAGLIGNHLKKIDSINNTETMNKKQKRKKERKHYIKIKNIMNEVHWKTIKHITNNYGNVIIGNLSMKDASKKSKSKLSPELKRIGLMMRFSEFRNRLRYKCLINGVKVEVIDEAYTSKVCSTCGNCKHELGGEKDYECNVCKITRDRDFNSATNMILLKM